MKIREFLNSLKDINLDDDYVSVQFAGNYSGSIRDVKVENTKVILQQMSQKIATSLVWQMNGTNN